ncbi:MAG TPA: hypothetical protein VGM90_13690 [Kofleriaceae bacterium]|jgi:hypothetical protein
MKPAIVLLLLAACSDSRPSVLLSASRISVDELGAPGFVDIDAPLDADIRVDMPRLLDGSEVPDLNKELVRGNSLKLAISAICNTAHGVDTTVLVDVHDHDDGRNATLVVDVADNGSNACLADVQIWKDCEGPECIGTTPCATQPPAIPPTRLAIAARGTDARICVRAQAVAIEHPITDLHPEVLLGAPLDMTMPRPLETTLEDKAFTFHAVDDTTRFLAVEGTDWLVGPYTLTVSTRVNGLTIARTLELDIGQPPDAGIEVSESPPATEFTVSQWDVHVHHFSPQACMLSLKPGPGFTAILADANNRVDPSRVPLDCSAAHAAYKLRIAPTISSDDMLSAKLSATQGTTTLAMATVAAKVRSTADEIVGCDTPQPQKASLSDGVCADIDADGTLEVLDISSGVMGGCLTEVSGAAATGEYDWRAGTSAPLSTPGAFSDVFTLATSPPQIWAVDTDGQMWTLVKDDTPQNTAMPHWVRQYQNVRMGPTVVPFRNGFQAGPPNALASLVPGGIQFVDLDAHVAKKVTLSDPSPLAIGAIRTATGGANIVIVSSAGATPSSYPVKIYSPDLSPLGGSVGDLMWNVSGVAASMPSGAKVEIAGRGTAQQDLVMVFYEGEFATAVTEMQINGAGTSLITGDQYAGVNGLAATPDGDVLLGFQEGTKLSSGTYPMPKYVPYDPAPPTDPSSTYGRAVTPCLDMMGSTIGFTERTSSGSRVVKRDITPEAP